MLGPNRSLNRVKLKSFDNTELKPESDKKSPKMHRLYNDYIVSNSPALYEELVEDNIQSFINQSAYKMLREIVRAA